MSGRDAGPADDREKGRVSRRGLFGFLGRGLRDAKEAAKDVAREERAAREAAKKGVADPAPVPRPASPSYPRRLRPAAESVATALDAGGRVLLDLAARPVPVGGSLRVTATGLAEPLLFVRVNEGHFATVTGECPLDGSDVLWHGTRDCAWCPSCGSQWRLDGEVLRGPARDPLVSCHTDVLEDRARITP